MTIHFKIGGTWTQVNRVYIKDANIWKPSNSVWIKSGGTWQEAFHYDVTPPAPPILTLELIETTYTEDKVDKDGRHIKVSVREPGGQNSQLKRIRVLTTYNGGMPTTQYGGTYISQPADAYPNEPWSDYHFNGFGQSSATKDTTVDRSKSYPRNSTSSTNLAAGTYYFAAWSEDLYGNWSTGVFSSINVPKKGGSDVLVKEARFQATSTGSYTNAGFVSGDLVQQNSPRSQGLYLYGNQIHNQIGSQGTPTIKSAQIFLDRRNDSGSGNANVYLFWHAYASASDIGSSLTRNEITDLGQIAKGETKWFDIPSTYYDNLVSGLYGFGLAFKDPAKASASASDYSVMKKIGDAPRSGEVHVVWTEKP